MSDDNSFFEELQTDFLNEISFLLETYEEHMLGLENDDDKKEHLTQIFRVAHSIKGGAAAVGFQDFSHFAHHVEDLLSVLRNSPEYVNSEVISILLKSGDEFKNRVQMLRDNDKSNWDVSALESKISQVLAGLGTGTPAPADVEEMPTPSFAPNSAPAAPAIVEEVDNTNYDLLHELMSELPPEVLEEYEKGQNGVKSETTPDLKVVASNPNPTPATPSSKPAAVASAEPKKEAQASSKSATKANVNQIIKVDTTRVDNVLNAVGELVVLKNQIVQNDIVRDGNNSELAAMVDQIDKAVRELYDKTLSIRMTPLKSLFLKIQRIVRDVSLDLDKPVNLELKGEETEVERTVFELLGDPLVHLVRNAMDHGVEKRETRKKNNKPEVAKVTVAAKQMGGNVIIEISDDGGGINRDKVLHKAIEKKIVPDTVNPDNLTNEEVFKFIFAAGFSTADKISDLSGRGVGLDVVKSNIERVNGKINIESKEGHGSVFRLTIPLSTAITDGIVVQIKSERYILPIYTIKEIIRVKKNMLTTLPGKGVVAKVRESLHRVLDLDPLLNDLANKGQSKNNFATIERKDRADEIMLVIIESGHLTSALPVDDVLGQAQVVVKSLTIGAEIPEVSGAAILGDGKTVLILDPGQIIRSANGNSGAEAVA
ncbi:MAG: chemotaxis protein CheA [Bdellovibrionaceae bacterium]|nr:chemotaxis protein CheA [Pseudobdellovibrionaceae bacterium]